MEVSEILSSYTGLVFDITGINLRVQSIRTTALSPEVLSAAVGQEMSAPNRVMVTPDSYASILCGFPDQVSSLVLILCFVNHVSNFLMDLGKKVKSV